MAKLCWAAPAPRSPRTCLNLPRHRFLLFLLCFNLITQHRRQCIISYSNKLALAYIPVQTIPLILHLSLQLNKLSFKRKRVDSSIDHLHNLKSRSQKFQLKVFRQFRADNYAIQSIPVKPEMFIVLLMHCGES